MSKYEPLWIYIREKKPEQLTFAEIEEICGLPIDHSFLKCKKELNDYGYAVKKISMKDQLVKFEAANPGNES